MTPKNIIQLISLLLGVGGLIALFLITERKTKAQMENTAQAIAEWQKIVERSHQDLKEAKERAQATLQSARNGRTFRVFVPHHLIFCPPINKFSEKFCIP